MAVEALVSVQEYLATSYDPDVEYVDGRLVERNVGEHDHSRLQIILASLLRERERDRRFAAFTEQRLRISSTRYRIPDVCVMALPYRREPVLTRPPHLVIEVRSPEDRFPEILAKVSDYLGAGVEHVWIVDPYRRTVREFGPDLDRSVEELSVATELVGEVDFRALFAELDRPTE
jgi:Uma2 family endonuclease